MDSASRRPWETQGTTSQPQNSNTQTLPSIATLVPNMDSHPPEKAPLNLSMSAVQESNNGNWSAPSSSQTAPSGYSSNPMPYLNSSHQSPNRFSGPSVTSPFTSESSAGPSPSFAPNHQAQALPSMTSNYDASQHRGSGDFEDSRRSSVDSRVHQSMDRLALGPTSPYASANASQASIVSAHLQRERGIQPNGSYRGPRFSGVGPISPLAPRNSDARGFIAGRVAPPILENPSREVYSAPVPSAGQAYAFPDPDAPDSAVSKPSRRGSYASSVTSSFMTRESAYPAGQHELPTHHHSLQHKQLTELQDDPDSPNSTTPYSRTPELRVTHKLAERKRRSEMKDCFEMLRARLPPNQNNKSSKWETLNKAIEYIQQLETELKHYKVESGKQRQQMEHMDVQMKELSQQLQRAQSQGQYQTPPTALSPSPLGFGNHYGNGVDQSSEPPRTLPPLMNGAMQGVQYSDDRR